MCTQTIKVPFSSTVFPGSELITVLPRMATAISKIRLVLNSPSVQLEECIQEAEILGVEKIYGEFIRIENDLKTSIEKQATRLGSRVYPIPFTCLENLYFDRITLRILFAGEGQDSIQGHFLIDYVETHFVPKEPYFKPVRQIAVIKSPLQSSRKVTLDVYLPGSVYQLFFTIRDSSGAFYTSLLKNVTLILDDKERFNLSGKHLQYIEPFKVYGAYSNLSAMYSFAIPEGGGQTELGTRQRFIFDLENNSLNGILTIWSLSRNFVYNAKKVFESYETPLSYVSVPSTSLSPIPFLVSGNSQNGVITVVTNSNVSTGQPLIATYPPPSSVVTYKGSGYAPVQCTFNYVPFIAPPSNIISAASNVYVVQDGNNHLYYTYGSNVASIDQYGNVYVLTTGGSLYKYSQNMTNLLYTRTGVSGLPGSYLGYEAFPLLASNILTSNGTINTRGIVMYSVLADSKYVYSTNGSNVYMYTQNTLSTVHTVQLPGPSSLKCFLAFSSTGLVCAKESNVFTLTSELGFTQYQIPSPVTRLFVDDADDIFISSVSGTTLNVYQIGFSQSLVTYTGAAWYDVSFSGTYFTLLVGGTPGGWTSPDGTKVTTGNAYVHFIQPNPGKFLFTPVNHIANKSPVYYGTQITGVPLPYSGEVIIISATQTSPSTVNVFYQTQGWPSNSQCTLVQFGQSIAASKTGKFINAPVSNTSVTSTLNVVAQSPVLPSITSPPFVFTYTIGIITATIPVQQTPTTQSFTFTYSNILSFSSISLTYSPDGVSRWEPVPSPTLIPGTCTFSNLDGFFVRLEATEQIIGHVTSVPYHVSYTVGTILITGVTQINNTQYQVAFTFTGFPEDTTQFTLSQSISQFGVYQPIITDYTFPRVAITDNYWIHISATTTQLGTVTSEPFHTSHVTVPSITIGTVTQTKPNKQTVTFTTATDSGWDPAYPTYTMYQSVSSTGPFTSVVATTTVSPFTDAQITSNYYIIIGRPTLEFGTQYSPAVQVTYLPTPTITNLAGTQLTPNAQTISFTATGWLPDSSSAFYLYTNTGIRLAGPISASPFTNVTIANGAIVYVQGVSTILGTVNSSLFTVNFFPAPTITSLATTQASPTTQTISFVPSSSWSNGSPVSFTLYNYDTGVILAGSILNSPFTGVTITNGANVYVKGQSTILGIIYSSPITVNYVAGTISVPTFVQNNTRSVNIGWSSTLFSSSANVTISNSFTSSGPFTRLANVYMSQNPYTVTNLPHKSYVQLSVTNDTVYLNASNVSANPFLYANTLSITDIIPTASFASIKYTSTGFAGTDTVTTSGSIGPATITDGSIPAVLGTTGNVNVTVTVTDQNVGQFTSSSVTYIPLGQPTVTRPSTVSWAPYASTTPIVVQTSTDNTTWTPVITKTMGTSPATITLATTQYVSLLANSIEQTDSQQVSAGTYQVNWVYLPSLSTVQVQQSTDGQITWSTIGTATYSSGTAQVSGLGASPVTVRLVVNGYYSIPVLS